MTTRSPSSIVTTAMCTGLCAVFVLLPQKQALAQGTIAPAAAATERDGSRDFDFHFGTWKTHVSRLTNPLTGSKIWDQYDGVSLVRKVWNGRASIFELEAQGPAGHLEGVG